MTRRQFLHTSLSCAALTAGPLPLSAAEPGTSKPRIPIGFLGVGYSHGPDKARIVMASPGWEFVGIWDETETGRTGLREAGGQTGVAGPNS